MALERWSELEFPERDYNVYAGQGQDWFAGRATRDKPKAWTPREGFSFGGQRYLAGHPCMAYATLNFGWVLQNVDGKITVGRE